MNRAPADGTDTEPYRIVVGFAHKTFRATFPLIELVANQERLIFRARFGLSLLAGPWKIERAEVHSVSLIRGLMGKAVNIQGVGSLNWTIYSYKPEPLLLTLEELGYPVDWLAAR